MGQQRAGLVPPAPDGRRWGYCAGAATTVDHVLPRSREGTGQLGEHRHLLQRLQPRKGDRTPVEAGMVLQVKPTAPTWAALTAIARC